MVVLLDEVVYLAGLSPMRSCTSGHRRMRVGFCCYFHFLVTLWLLMHGHIKLE